MIETFFYFCFGFVTCIALAAIVGNKNKINEELQMKTLTIILKQLQQLQEKNS